MIINLCGSINPRTYADVEELPDFNRVRLGQGTNKILVVFKEYDEKLVNLIHKTLVVDPKKRLSIEEVFKQSYFTSNTNGKRLKTK